MKIHVLALENVITRLYQGLPNKATTRSLAPNQLSCSHLFSEAFFLINVSLSVICAVSVKSYVLQLVIILSSSVSLVLTIRILKQGLNYCPIPPPCYKVHSSSGHSGGLCQPLP